MTQDPGSAMTGIELFVLDVGQKSKCKVGYLNHPPGVKQTLFEGGSSTSNGEEVEVLQRDLQTDLDSLKEAKVSTLVTLCTKQELLYYGLSPGTLRKLLQDRGIEWIWCPMNSTFIKDSENQKAVSNLALAMQQIEQSVNALQFEAFPVFHARPDVLYVTSTAISCFLSLSQISAEMTLEAIQSKIGQPFTSNQFATIKDFVSRFQQTFQGLSPLLPIPKLVSTNSQKLLAATYPYFDRQPRFTRIVPTIVFGNSHSKVDGVNHWVVFVKRFNGDGDFSKSNDKGLGFIENVRFLQNKEVLTETLLKKQPFLISGSGKVTFMVEIVITFKPQLRIQPLHLEHELSFLKPEQSRLYSVDLLNRELKENLLDFKRTQIGWAKPAPSNSTSASSSKLLFHTSDWISQYFHSQSPRELSRRTLPELSSPGPISRAISAPGIIKEFTPRDHDPYLHNEPPFKGGRLPPLPPTSPSTLADALRMNKPSFAALKLPRNQSLRLVYQTSDSSSSDDESEDYDDDDDDDGDGSDMEPSESTRKSKSSSTKLGKSSSSRSASEMRTQFALARLRGDSNSCYDFADDLMNPEEERQIREWLDPLGLGEFSEVFIANQLTLHFLPCLTKEDLMEMGISDVQVQQRLVQAIKRSEASRMHSFTDHDETDLAFSHTMVHYREIPYKEILVHPEPIGRGAFGVVYKAFWRGQMVAVKKLQVFLDANHLEDFRREAAMMERVNYHPAISFFVGVCTEPEHLCFISKYYPKGSAYDLLIRENLQLEWRLIVKIAREAASGIYHLHKERVIHCDIAARNILVSDDWSGRVSDFGMSRIRKFAVAPCSRPSRGGPIRWMAPELLKNRQDYSAKSDAWSFGVVLWEMVARKRPYVDMTRDQVMEYVTSGNVLPIPPTCPSVFASLMRHCWQMDPALRPSFETIWKRLYDYSVELESESTS